MANGLTRAASGRLAVVEDEAQATDAGYGHLGHWSRLSTVTLAPVAARSGGPERPARTFSAPGLSPVELRLPVDLPALLRDLEDAFIAEALALSGGNKKEAAALLGMGRTTLVEKLRRRGALRGTLPVTQGTPGPVVAGEDGDVFSQDRPGP